MVDMVGSRALGVHTPPFTVVAGSLGHSAGKLLELFAAGFVPEIAVVAAMHGGMALPAECSDTIDDCAALVASDFLNIVAAARGWRHPLSGRRRFG